MYILIIPTENEYYGPFDTELKALDYLNKLEAKRNKVIDYQIESLGHDNG